jgi:hypothetical protein
MTINKYSKIFFMPFYIVILQSVITSLITVIIVFGTLFFFPSLLNGNADGQSAAATSQEVPLYPLSSTFFGIPLPTNDRGLDSARLTVELHGKLYSKNKRQNGMNITIQTPETRIHTFQADNSTQIVNGNFDDLDKLLVTGKELSIVAAYDLKTKSWQMEKLTLL